MATDILLIESNEETVGALRTALSAFDVALRVVPDGTRGIIEAEKQKPTAILLGLELPPKNYGYVVCQRLKKSDATSAVPLVLLYASATETDIERHRTLRHRADAYLKKPFAISQVVGMLDELLGSLPRRSTEAPPAPSGNGAENLRAPVEVTLHDDDILFDEDPPFAAPGAEPPSVATALPREDFIDLAGDLRADLDAVFPNESAKADAPEDAVSASVTVRGVARVPEAAAVPIKSPPTSSSDHESGLKAEVERLTRVAETLRDELEATKVQAGNELDDAKRRLKEAGAAVAAAEKTAAELTTSLDAARARAAAATTQADLLTARVAELEREVASRNASIATFRSAVDESTVKLGEVQSRLDAALQVRERMRRAVDILKRLTDD